jgi:hypothetical protein
MGIVPSCMAVRAPSSLLMLPVESRLALLVFLLSDPLTGLPLGLPPRRALGRTEVRMARSVLLASENVSIEGGPRMAL